MRSKAEIVQMIDYARNMASNERPDYKQLRETVGSLYRQHYKVFDNNFDWDYLKVM